jgi:hypothetical protein
VIIYVHELLNIYVYALHGSDQRYHNIKQKYFILFYKYSCYTVLHGTFIRICMDSDQRLKLVPQFVLPQIYYTSQYCPDTSISTRRSLCRRYRGLIRTIKTYSNANNQAFLRPTVFRYNDLLQKMWTSCTYHW